MEKGYSFTIIFYKDDAFSLVAGAELGQIVIYLFTTMSLSR